MRTEPLGPPKGMRQLLSVGRPMSERNTNWVAKSAYPMAAATTQSPSRRSRRHATHTPSGATMSTVSSFTRRQSAADTTNRRVRRHKAP